MRDMTYDVLTTVVSHPMRMDGARLRHLYEWTITSFASKLGQPPNTFDAKGGDFNGKKYLDYARGRRRLEATDFSNLSRVVCALFRQKQDSMTIGWEFSAGSLDRQVVLSSDNIRWEPTGRWATMLSMSPDLLDVSQAVCVDLASEFARLTVEEGGYVMFMHRNRGPAHYVLGMGYEAVRYPNDRTYDESANISSWSYARDIHLTRPWLRDIYPLNFLGPQLAAMPVEGSPLVEWLRADPAAHGTVEPFPCEREPGVLVWKPPVKRIPALRERLYRAGVVWHREYYVDHSDGETPPFVPKEPPPENMRAAFYAKWDPKLTR